MRVTDTRQLMGSQMFEEEEGSERDPFLSRVQVSGSLDNTHSHRGDHTEGAQTRPVCSNTEPQTLEPWKP